MRVITLWCVSFLLVTSLVFAEQKDKKKPEADSKETVQELELKMPPKDSASYWTIRSQAMTDLMPLLTRKRKEMKENVRLLAEYLISIDKADDFAGSDIDVPDDPELYAKAVGIYDKFKEKEIAIPKKPLTWDQTAELAMKFVLVEGYEPVEVDGKEEMEQYKKICQQKEKYARKVRQELRESTTKLLRGWLYLETIDKQASFRTYAYQEKQKAKEAKDKHFREGRERLAQLERARRLQMKRNRMNRHYGYYW